MFAEIRNEGRTWVVPSRSRGGLEHRVTLTMDGSYICTCEAATIGQRECWAIKYIREEVDMNGTIETTDIVPVQVLPPTALLPTERTYALIEKAAELALSGAVALPKELNSRDKVAAVMLYGYELGLRPMTSLQHLYIVNGRVQPSAQVMAGLLAARSDARIQVVESTEERCTLRLVWPSRRLNETWTVTMAEVNRAKLATSDVWQKYPKDKLVWHCTKRLLRVYAPDIINGLIGPVIDSRGEDDEEEVDTSDLYNPGDSHVIDHETGEIIDLTPTHEEGQQAGAAPSPDDLGEWWKVTRDDGFDRDFVLRKSEECFEGKQPMYLTPEQRADLLEKLRETKALPGQQGML